MPLSNRVCHPYTDPIALPEPTMGNRLDLLRSAIDPIRSEASP